MDHHPNKNLGRSQSNNEFYVSEEINPANGKPYRFGTAKTSRKRPTNGRGGSRNRTARPLSQSQAVRIKNLSRTAAQLGFRSSKFLEHNPYMKRKVGTKKGKFLTQISRKIGFNDDF